MNKNTKFQSETLFSGDKISGNRWKIFQQSKQGHLYNVIPFDELAQLLPSRSPNKAGAPSWFSNQGMLGLMFLKHYLGLSDEKLIERINTDWSLQMFCGRHFNDNRQIKDFNLPSRIRTYLGDHIRLEEFQVIMIDNWKPFMEDIHCGCSDATAYESYIKFPTDEKLLWDCCVWVFESLFVLCKELGIKRPRSKYKDQQIKQTNFSKTKKKTYKLKKQRRKSLLYLLNKGINYIINLLESNLDQIEIKTYFSIIAKLATVQTIYKQQKYMHNNPGEYAKDRIVSLFKPYLRPIVRGKENKRVEFGAKVHMHQVDGINIIDKLSFDPFNEAMSLKGCVLRHKEMFGELYQLGVDNIYGTNKNRKYLTENKISTCLPSKGKQSEKYKDQTRQLRKELGKQRATVLEGSFGNEKNHYSLKKIKARTQETETIWILFGVMTANAVKISKRKKTLKLAS